MMTICRSRMKLENMSVPFEYISMGWGGDMIVANVINSVCPTGAYIAHNIRFLREKCAHRFT